MERLQGPINPCILDVACLEQVGFVNTGSLLRFEEEEEEEEEEAQFSSSILPSLEDNMPFLQILQSVETPSFFALKEPNFQTLLRLQHLKKPWEINTFMPVETETTQVHQALELESCVTQDVVNDFQLPVKSETKSIIQNPRSISSCPEVPNQEQQQPNSIEPWCGTNEPNSASSFPWTHHSQTRPNETTHYSKSCPAITKERRKRKRTRPIKNKEEVESQRMTHIAVERNRRRQMNDHINSLRSLMPPSYVQRGDQASIIGGAIDFVKELEQLLHFLEAEKRLRKTEEAPTAGLFASQAQSDIGSCEEYQTEVKRRSEAAEIEVTAMQNHVNLKIHCERKPGQLLRAIVALQDLRLTVLHLNITSSQTTVLYSFSLKIEENCKLRSADEVAAAIHQIFGIINSSS